MTDFIITRNPSPKYFSQTQFKPQVITPFESGKGQSRAAATSAKMKFSIGWEGITETELQALYTFHALNIGGTFNYTHPTTSTVYVVRFGKGQDMLPEAKYIGMVDDEDGWEIGPIGLEEV